MESKVGRNLQHLEDLVFVDGSEGAMRAVNILQRFEKDVSDVSIKWDGTPAVIFGRDEAGDFILTDIAGFNAKGYDGRVKSAEDLEAMLLNRGNREVDDERRAFASSMRDAWDAFEQATPEDMRGFIHGDLLYKDTPPLKNGQYVFTPNKVTYSVKAKSEIGQRIAQSDVGVVIHTFTTPDGDVQPASPDMLREGRLFVMPPVYMQQGAKIDVKGLEKLRADVKKNAQLIDKLVEPQPGLGDIRNIIYTYVNQMAKAKQWDKLKSGFEGWLKSSGVSPNKQAKILSSPEFKQYALLFDLVLRIQAMKNQVIDQFEQAPVDVQASTGGQRGGEGYVAARDKVKLVPRHKWTIG
jgi:hypothetical protein